MACRVWPRPAATRWDTMIRYLGIQRLAVIDSLEVELDSGLTVLTGETGAGKSIVVGAIALLTGARAYPGLVRTGEKTAVVQAVFERPDGTELTLRRELSAQGRSRAFVDGSLTPLTTLRATTEDLIDLHGQHDHQLLLESRYQLDLMDAFAGLATERDAVREAFATFNEARARLEQVRSQSRTATERVDFLEFQLAEIAKVTPQPGEDEALQSARHVLANAGRLRDLSSQIYQRLYEGDSAVLTELGAVWRGLSELVELDPSFAPYLAVREETESKFEDMAFTLRKYADGLEASDAKLEDVEARLAALERLKRKHGGTLDSVLHQEQELQSELDGLVHSSGELDQLTEKCDAGRTGYLEAASNLSTKRRAAAGALTHQLQGALEELAMKGARCEFHFTTVGDDEAQWSPFGIDGGELYLSANPGEDLRPLSKVASGGEFSRVMLALKTIASTDAPGKTLIFDEVDAGIGGEVANVVARRLRALGDRFQVLCITHLPQIAAAGSTHLSVSKSVERKRTVTRIKLLDPDGRTDEISRMIAGATDSEALRSSARELLDAVDEHKTKGESETAKAKGGLFD